MDSVEVVVAGDGAIARQWVGLLARAQRARLVARVADLGGGPSDTPHFSTLQQAIETNPEARYALALPARASRVAVEELGAAGMQCLVQPGASTSSRFDPTWVAMDWATLEGPAKVRRLVRDARPERASLHVRGQPACDAGSEADLALTLVQALALAHAALGELELSEILELSGGHVQLRGRVGDMAVELSVRADPAASARLEVFAETTIHWQANDDGERLTLRQGGQSRDRSWPVTPAPARSLSLLGGPSNLGLWQAARARMTEVENLLGHALPPSPAPFAAVSEQLAKGHAIDSTLFGLEPPDLAGGPSGTVLDLELPTLPMEIHAFRAGLKPVVFLTLTPGEEARVLALVEGAEVIRRERRVDTDRQDNWIDNRDRGEPRVELYIGHDRALVERAAHLQAETDPSHALFELGQLMGYPACCVKAFAEQTDRSNNTANRYCSLARTGPTRPLPWVLNNLFITLSPFFPCSYECREAVRFAETLLAEIEREEPKRYQSFARGLRGKFLYLMHGQWLRMSEGELTRPAGLAAELLPLARACAESDDFELRSDALLLIRSGSEYLRLGRLDPGLGIQLEFG